MELYTITLNPGETLQGYTKIDYAGHAAYGKETFKGSDVFPVNQIFFAEEVIEAIKE